jgi:hypothetical protein
MMSENLKHRNSGPLRMIDSTITMRWVLASMVLMSGVRAYLDCEMTVRSDIIIEPYGLIISNLQFNTTLTVFDNWLITGIGGGQSSSIYKTELLDYYSTLNSTMNKDVYIYTQSGKTMNYLFIYEGNSFLKAQSADQSFTGDVCSIMMIWA